jgi:prevent-host-death family protein
MKTYTYSEARQKLAALLDRARREGRVQIRRRDGQLFVLQPAKPEGSPLDVPGVPTKLRRGEVLEWLRTSREESGDRLLERKLSNKRMQATKTRPRG